MGSKDKKKQTYYPYSKIRVYWSAVITVLSVILAILMLQSSVFLLSYLLLTALFTAIVLAFKIRFFHVGMSESSEEGSSAEGGAFGWRSLLVLVVVLLISLSLPLLLAPVYPELWFISLVSYTTSVSIAEVLFFLITSKG